MSTISATPRRIDSAVDRYAAPKADLERAKDIAKGAGQELALTAQGHVAWNLSNMIGDGKHAVPLSAALYLPNLITGVVLSGVMMAGSAAFAAKAGAEALFIAATSPWSRV